MSEQTPPATPPTPPGTPTASDDDRQDYSAVGIVFFCVGITFFAIESMRLVGLPFLVLGITFFAWSMKRNADAAKQRENEGDDDDGSTTPNPAGDRDE